MTTVTRYRMEGRIVEAREINPLDSDVRYADVDAVEALNGEWVKWEDVKSLLTAQEPATAIDEPDEPRVVQLVRPFPWIPTRK